MKKLNVLLAGMAVLILTLPVIVSADTKPVLEAEEIIQAQPTPPAKPTSNTPALGRPASPQAFQLNWLSINGGGAISASSTNYRLGLSVGQSVAGAASSTSYQMGIGFWYGTGGAPACAAARGDMNASGTWTPADVAIMLSCAYVTGYAGNCNLCFADVNCTGTLTPADVALELNRIYLLSPLPCI